MVPSEDPLHVLPPREVALLLRQMLLLLVDPSVRQGAIVVRRLLQGLEGLQDAILVSAVPCRGMNNGILVLFFLLFVVVVLVLSCEFVLLKFLSCSGLVAKGVVLYKGTTTLKPTSSTVVITLLQFLHSSNKKNLHCCLHLP